MAISIQPTTEVSPGSRGDTANPPDRILRSRDEIQRSLRRGHQGPILGHAVSFGQGDRRQPVRIHRAPTALVQPAVPLHAVDQVRQAALDLLAVTALDVRLPGAQKRQQCHRGGTVSRVGQAARIDRTISPVGGSQAMIEAPATVVHLDCGNPSQCCGHRRLALFVAAIFGDHGLASPLAAAFESRTAEAADLLIQVAPGRCLGTEIHQIDRNRCRIDVRRHSHLSHILGNHAGNHLHRYRIGQENPC
jgi:hypothetical protein